jgi:hypothetical protein
MIFVKSIVIKIDLYRVTLYSIIVLNYETQINIFPRLFILLDLYLNQVNTMLARYTR